MNNYSSTYAKLDAELISLSQEIIRELQQSIDPDYKLLLKQLQNASVQCWPELMSGVYSAKLRQQKTRLEKLEAALSQIQIGMYGNCADCEAPIEKYLLDIDPARQRCKRCQC